MKGLALNRLDEQVVITCYWTTEKKTRRKALEEYYWHMKCSEGCEHQRYETIFFQLLVGYMECSDQIPFNRI